MILVDTSVWIDYLRHGDSTLVTALEAGRVVMHPFIVGELAGGHLQRRAEILTLLRALPQAPVATDEEALVFIETRHLMGRGIGYLDVHLLASVALAGTARLWTRDRRLAAAARDLALAVAEQPSAGTSGQSSDDNHPDGRGLRAPGSVADEHPDGRVSVGTC